MMSLGFIGCGRVASEAVSAGFEVLIPEGCPYFPLLDLGIVVEVFIEYVTGEERWMSMSRDRQDPECFTKCVGVRQGEVLTAMCHDWKIGEVTAESNSLA